MEALREELDTKVSVVAEVCRHLSAGDQCSAEDVARQYPPKLSERELKRLSNYDRVSVFVRDGFLDRYTGARVIHPVALRILGEELGNLFPWHAHGSQKVAHIANWELMATVDHRIPVQRGGSNDKSNLITASMNMNGAKGMQTVEELPFDLHEPGDPEEWDGLSGWFLSYVEHKPEYMEVSGNVRDWHRATRSVARTLT